MKVNRVNLDLNGHELLLVKVALDAEVQFWERLAKRDESRGYPDEGAATTASCIQSLRTLITKFELLLESLHLPDGAPRPKLVCEDPSD